MQGWWGWGCLSLKIEGGSGHFRGGGWGGGPGGWALRAVWVGGAKYFLGGRNSHQVLGCPLYGMSHTLFFA